MSQAETATNSNKSKKKWIIENVTSLGLALLLVFTIRSSIVEAFKIPSGSMIPTLLIGDHIFVNKFSYGIKLPFSDWILDHPIYLIPRDPPKRGDIIVFTFPKDESLYYIKRVVGVPGDTIEVRSKVLYINGKPAEQQKFKPEESEKIYNSLDDPKYSRTNLDLYHEKIDQLEHTIMIDHTNFWAENHLPTTIPADHLFVMGDNRDFSNDSRFWGFVPFKNIRGKAMVIWLSWWFNFSESQYYFRPSRIGTLLK